MIPRPSPSSAARLGGARFWFPVFLTLLWLGTTFVYLGDTGKYSDDYWVNGRFVEREGIDWSSHPWRMWPYFWRPLHLIHVWVMNTALWRHDWAIHLELALAHAAVCVALYRLLVRLGSARGPAIGATLLYGTCPLLGEAISWSSASCNAIGALLMLLTLGLGCRVASDPFVAPSGRASFSRPGARRLTLIAILSFATACFYEPAAAGLAAMPVVVWGACSPVARGVERMRRAAMATLAAGLPCMLYMALLLGTAPPRGRGAAATVAQLHSFPENSRRMARAFGSVLFGSAGREYLQGSIEQGLAAAREHPVVMGIIVLTALTGVLAAWDAHRSRCSASAPPKGPSAPARGQLVFAGLTLLIVPWVPFIAQHAHSFALRSLYVPLIGVAILIAAAGNGLYRGLAMLSDHGRERFRVVALVAVGALAIAGEIGQVGVQTQFRTLARQDALVEAQLAAMSPEVEPGTVFLIVASEQSGAATSCAGYNAFLHGPLKEPWCASIFAQRAMRRTDIRLVTSVFWSRGLLPIEHLAPESFREPISGEGVPTPWTEVVPLWIDGESRIHIMETLSLSPLAGPVLEVRVPRAVRLAQAMSESGATPVVGTPRHIRLVELPNHRTRVVVDSSGKEPLPGTSSGMR